MAPSGSVRKAVLLAGGRGQRLAPLTFAVNKHLLPVDGVPMIYYPLTSLMALGVREIGVVVDPRDLDAFKRLLGDGTHLGLRLDWLVQDQPRGLPDGLLVAESYLDSQSCLLVLGDTLLIGNEPLSCLRRLLMREKGAGVMAIPSARPHCFGVLELDERGSIDSLVEKPRKPRSNLVMPGVYVLDSQAVNLARELKPSGRGELEIVDLLRLYHRRGELAYERLKESTSWFDLGTATALARANRLVRQIRVETGRWVACPEEVAFRRGDLTQADLVARAERHPNRYGRYLRSIAKS